MAFQSHSQLVNVNPIRNALILAPEVVCSKYHICKMILFLYFKVQFYGTILQRKLMLFDFLYSAELVLSEHWQACLHKLITLTSKHKILAHVKIS